MSEGKELVQNLTGAELGASPYIEEQIAVEATNGLRGAEIGLRGFRSRPLLRRVWEGITGEGQERVAAWGQDLVVAQRATLAIVNTVMSESIRTKKCVIRVLHNLHQVNADLDELQEEVPRLDARITAVREELLSECRRIALDVQHTKELAMFLARREAEVRRLGDRFRANALHPGTGELVGASLYLAQHVRHFSGESADQVRAERATALATIEDRLGKRVMPLSELVAEALGAVDEDALEATALVAEGSQGPMGRLLLPLMERRLAGVAVGNRDVDEAIAVVRRLKDPDRRLATNLLRPREFVEVFVDELEDQNRGDK